MSALVSLAEGEPRAALLSAERAALLNPRDAEPQVLRARALEQLGRMGEAADALGGAIALIEPPARPQPDLYVEHARLLLADALPRRADALRSLGAGLSRLGPTVSLALPAMELEVELGRFDAARTRLEALPLSAAQKRERHEMIDARAATAP
jgi:tetratricopeptide (TPR) repeat protein